MERTRNLEILAQADTRQALQAACSDLRDQLQVGHVAYRWFDTSGMHDSCATYSLAWQERYLAQNYQRIDPVVTGCFQRFQPVDWKELDWSSRAARAFQQEALEHGIGTQGFSVPVRGPGGQFALLSVNQTCDDAAWRALCSGHRHELMLIAHYLNEKVLEFEDDRPRDAGQPLSPREVDAMTLLAVGLSRAQAAENLSISEHTLRVYIESARFKLGALNTTHAVARALSMGLIVV